MRPGHCGGSLAPRCRAVVAVASMAASPVTYTAVTVPAPSEDAEESPSRLCIHEFTRAAKRCTALPTAPALLLPYVRPPLDVAAVLRSPARSEVALAISGRWPSNCRSTARTCDGTMSQSTSLPPLNVVVGRPG